MVVGVGRSERGRLRRMRRYRSWRSVESDAADCFWERRRVPIRSGSLSGGVVGAPAVAAASAPPHMLREQARLDRSSPVWPLGERCGFWRCVHAAGGRAEREKPDRDEDPVRERTGAGRRHGHEASASDCLGQSEQGGGAVQSSRVRLI